MTENLNIEYHVKRLVYHALNSSSTQKEAAEKLKINPRTLRQYISMYCMQYKDNKWSFKYIKYGD